MPPRRPTSSRSLSLVAALAAGIASLTIPVGADASPQQGYTVSIAGPKSDPRVGGSFQITGTVAPGAAGERVRLERSDRGHFHVVGHDRLNRSSSYVFTQRFDAVGGHVYRVVKSAHGQYGRGASVPLWVFVTGSTLPAGVELQGGDSLISYRSSYRLTLQPSGDLVISLTSTGRVIWSFGTDGNPGDRAVLRHDGNLVVLDHHGHKILDTGSGGGPRGGYSMSLNGLSDLVIHAPDGSTVWSSDTTNPLLRVHETLLPGQYLRSTDQHYQLVMQRNGNLVLYDRSDGSAQWDAGTDVPGSTALMGPAGRLGVYAPDGTLLWYTKTLHYPGTIATMQTDGNLVLTHTGTVIWAVHLAGQVLGDDYPAYLRKADQDSIIDPWHFMNRECTSFVAWRMNDANGIAFDNFMDGGHFGNAYNWDDNARALGYTVDTVPAIGAIAESDSYGHVAWVAAVGDGEITVEDYNWIPGAYDVRTVPTSSYQYIHIADLKGQQGRLLHAPPLRPERMPPAARVRPNGRYDPAP